MAAMPKVTTRRSIMTAKTKNAKSAKVPGPVAKGAKVKKKPTNPSGSEKKLSAIAAAARVLAETKKPMSSAEWQALKERRL
jgi:hypothetical protein